ncbi:MAG: ABC transporter permease subunit [Pirellulales bacterium]|nr:ABC transporter permease subunit [Pirellulales bacterium]
MLVGPVFTREFTIAPRRPRLYIARASYVLGLMGLMSVAWLVVTGTQVVRDIGDLARFGTMLFQILAPLQMVVGLFFASLLTASAVSQEKDRRTLILLLLTNMTNSELVLGKLLASLLHVLVLLLATVPLFMICVLLGGVSFTQVGQALAVTLATTIFCGSLGSMLALWREKTFQALALTVLIIVLWIAVLEIVATGTFGAGFAGLSAQELAAGMSPWQAIIETTQPFSRPSPALGILGTTTNLYLLTSVLAAVAINVVAIAMVRVWNPSREARPLTAAEQAEAEEVLFEKDAHIRVEKAKEKAKTAPEPVRTRRVWDNPIVWREIRTWAYGRKILVIRLAYLLLFGLALTGLFWLGGDIQTMTRAQGAMALVPLFLLSLFLLNVQAVTSLTSERDARALDLLLVTDLTPKEIVFGKLGGIFYNTKEMILLPVLLCIYLCYAGAIGLENLIYLLLGLAVLIVFVAVLGVHVGMNYFNSRTAVATSLGTLFFLFVGVATCMRMMIAFSGSFQAQLQPFLAFTVGGGIGLYVALGARNPSTAIGIASFLSPFLTFYAITSFLMNDTLAVFLVTAGAYGFMTAAMLVPAISEFDVATGRTTIGEE